MEVRPTHSYGLQNASSKVIDVPMVDRLSAQPERRVSKASSVGTIKTGFTCMVANSDKEKPGRNIFIVGHSSGAIYVWRRQRFSSNTDESNGDKDRGPQAVLPSPAHDQLRDSRYMHKGPVTALKMQPKTQFLYSGSADRTIKLWDIFDSEHPPCLRQTFSGHGGSVTCIEFAPLMGQYPGYMMTGSTDQTVILWKNADGREMMLYPFYIKMRVIELKEWPTSLLFLSTRMAHGDLHIGDSAGKIWRMAFEMQDSKAGGGLRQTEPKVWTGMSSHQLGILQMVAEPHEGVILSISNDITVKVWESLSGASKKMLKNDNRVRFNAMHVDAANCDVYLVDSLGFLTVWNWVSERTMLVQRLTHVENGLLAVSFSALVSCNTQATELYVLRGSKIESYMIVRGMAHVALRGHTEPVLGLALMPPDRDDIYGQDMLYSCALDNTLRGWDPMSLETSFFLKEPLDTEMSCMATLRHLGVVLTGNDDGSLRLWDLTSGKHSFCKEHTNTISAIATCFTGQADGARGAGLAHSKDLVFTCGFDGEVVTWEVLTTRIKNTPDVNKDAFRAKIDALAEGGDGGEEGHSSLGQYINESMDAMGNLSLEGADPASPGQKKKESMDATRKLSAMGRTKAHKEEILCCAHIFLLGQDNPSGMLLTAGNDRMIKRWRINDRLDLELDAQLTCPDPMGHKIWFCHNDAISCMALDGNFLFTGSDDCTIKIWNMAAEATWNSSAQPTLDSCLIRVLGYESGGHQEAIKSLLIIQPDGLLVSLDSAKVIKIWDYTKGTVIWETRHESDDLTCMIYDYAKSTLVCGTEQCTIVTVDVPDLHNLLELPETTLEVGHHSQHEGEKEGAWEDGGEAVAEEGGLEEGEHDKPVEEQP